MTEMELALTPDRMSHPESPAAHEEARDCKGRLAPEFESASTSGSFDLFPPLCQSLNHIRCGISAGSEQKGRKENDCPAAVTFRIYKSGSGRHHRV